MPAQLLHLAEISMLLLVVEYYLKNLVSTLNSKQACPLPSSKILDIWEVGVLAVGGISLDKALGLLYYTVAKNIDGAHGLDSLRSIEIY